MRGYPARLGRYLNFKINIIRLLTDIRGHLLDIFSNFYRFAGKYRSVIWYQSQRVDGGCNR